MKNIDIHGMTNMELIRGGIAEWYWATDYIHGDIYEAEELFRQAPCAEQPFVSYPLPRRHGL